MMENWTFGIITEGAQDARIQKILTSIHRQNFAKWGGRYEVIIVGNSGIGELQGSRSQPGNLPFDAVCAVDFSRSVIPFDESQKRGWITRKKNIIAEQAKFPNLCLMHDYVELLPGWYEGFLRFGPHWDVCMNEVQNLDGTRFRDWLEENHFLDYTDRSRVHSTMYVSGTYYCIKAEYARKHPLNENLCWGQAEDVEWCNRIRPTWNYRFNPQSPVRCLKQK